MANGDAAEQVWTEGARPLRRVRSLLSRALEFAAAIVAEQAGAAVAMARKMPHFSYRFFCDASRVPAYDVEG